MQKPPTTVIHTVLLNQTEVKELHDDQTLVQWNHNHSRCHIHNTLNVAILRPCNSSQTGLALRHLKMFMQFLQARAILSIFSPNSVMFPFLFYYSSHYGYWCYYSWMTRLPAVTTLESFLGQVHTRQQAPAWRLELWCNAEREPTISNNFIALFFFDTSHICTQEIHSKHGIFNVLNNLTRLGNHLLTSRLLM